MTSILFLLLSFTALPVLGSSYQAAEYNRMVESSALSQGRPGTKDPNVISGSCEFEGGSCNGAEVSIFDGAASVFTATLLSNGAFQTRTLPRGRSLRLVLSWPRHGFTETRNVNVGDHVAFRLVKP